MTRIWIAVVAGGIFAAQASAEPKIFSKSELERLSYSIGVSVARNFKQQGIEVELESLFKGIRAELAGEKLLLSDSELKNITDTFQADLRRKQKFELRRDRFENHKEGADFLAANKKKEGVVTLPSGLQYKILKAGDGQKPTEKDTVECEFRGTFIDGSEFDSSRKEGKPATLTISKLIPGWREAMKLMPVGSKWQLFIPPELGYGFKGSNTGIGPNMTLLIEVELLKIIPTK